MYLYYCYGLIFSSRTLVAKALKVLIMLVGQDIGLFCQFFFIFQNRIFQIIPSNLVKLFFQKILSFQIHLSKSDF